MLKRILPITISAYLLLIVSCSKDTVNKEVNTNKETCLQFIDKTTDLTCFKAALERIELAKDPVYLQNGPYSFFAPDDAAFKKVGLNVEAIRNYDWEALKKIVYGHILAGRLGGGVAGGFYSIDALCLSKDYRPILSRNYYGLFLNGHASTATADLGDGLVHKLNDVAFPGTDNLWQIIKARPELSMFTTLIEQASDHGLTNIYDFKEILSTRGERFAWNNSTALCPTNEAFAAAGYKTIADFDRLALNEKIGILIVHVSNGYSFTSDYIQNDLLAPGSNILKKGRSVIFPRLLVTNIKGANGVAHIIDQVIP